MSTSSYSLYDRVHGGLLGGAVGDALGAPIEAMHFQFIRELHDGPITGMVEFDRPKEFFQPGQGAYTRANTPGAYTDDTRLARLIIRTILRVGGRITADDLAETWMKEMDVSEFWMSIDASYHRIAYSAVDPRSAGIGNIPDNSSAMCIGPIGVINAGDPKEASRDAYEIASLSHDGYSRDAACVIAAATAEAMHPTATVSSVCEAARRSLPNAGHNVLTAPLSRSIDLANESIDRFPASGAGRASRVLERTEWLTRTYWEELLVPFVQRGPNPVPSNERLSPSVEPLESVPVALGMFIAAEGDYRGAVLGSANFGRDCDTIACMTGYIAGAFGGASAIPSEWIARVQGTHPEPDYEELARDMTHTLRSMAEAAPISGLLTADQESS